MTRLALITGGTRGIGAAIARRLQQDGCRAAVIYRGNEVAAKAFRDATAIAADPWDASDFDACFNMMAAVDPKVLEGVVAQIPVGRLAQPAEIAHAVAFLIDEQSGFITGSTLSINGGQSPI